ncbi:DUF4232 domain-containing protein [Streptomyces sp. NPDC086549]|uniref:DUF4232 domain-containing protein n=1 Tax=Streptomyces sp. NPDC086549 TaxID=3365752 RepID=UPI00382F270D
MQYEKGFRRTAMAMAAVSAALVVTACQPGGDEPAAESPSQTPSTASATTTPGHPSVKPSGPGTPKASATSASTADTGSGSSGKAAKTCAPTALKATARQAAVRPDGTGIGAAVVEFTNVSAQPCVLQGHPTVAGAGNGAPQHNSPLAVTPTGTASPVTVTPGAKAWVKLTFVQVQGEADGYCESGAKPVVYPTMVIGLPGSGAQQVALDDGQFAECDNKVTVNAVSAAKPS